MSRASAHPTAANTESRASPAESPSALALAPGNWIPAEWRSLPLIARARKLQLRRSSWRRQRQRTHALARNRQRLMRRRDAKTAAGEMRVEQRPERIDALRIECRQRLVEHPQRTPDESQPRKPDPSPLPLRQHAYRQPSLPRQGDRVERFDDRIGVRRSIVKRNPRAQVVFGAQFILQRGQVTVERDGLTHPWIERSHRLAL